MIFQLMTRFVTKFMHFCEVCKHS